MPQTVAKQTLVLRPPADLTRAHPGLGRMATDLALRYAPRELVTEDMLRAMGEGLWRALDAAEDLAGARAAAGLAVLPIVVESSEPSVLRLPWETLHHPELGFLGRDPAFALSRRLGPSPAEAPDLDKGPLRVLLFTSLPEDLDPERRRRFTGILVGESERLSAVVNRMLEFAAEEGAAGAAGGPPPAEAVSDFLQAHDNHFPALEEAAAALAEETGLPPLAGSRELAALLTERFDLTVSLVAEPPEAQDAAAGQDFRLWSGSPEGTRRFQLAKRLAHCAAADRLDGVIESEPLAGAETAALCRDVLANYVAAALLMPYDEFLAAARALRYDIALLQQRFGTSFEQVCHRLTTLRRLGARGVPFHFLRVDIAGNLSKRFSASGLSIPRYGGLCPRWNVHAAFLAPGQIRRQVSRLPDDSTYFDIACTVVKAERGYHAPKSYFAIGLGCEISHARALVYSDGMDLETAEAAMPVGVTCRLCARDDCRQRAQAPILPSLQTA